jgi:hypothetical protein
MTNSDLIEVVDRLLCKSEEVLRTKRPNERVEVDCVDPGLMIGFRTVSLSFISNLYGKSHIYYEEFESCTRGYAIGCVNKGIGILNAIKEEIQRGWLASYRELISADIFTDFLEMAEYLLKRSYKDAAAVIIGSVLENHLRTLCKNNNVDTETVKPNDDKVAKRANTLNEALYKAEVYNKLMQKNICAWLEIRNNAAHGLYENYNEENVRLMYDGVLNFTSKCG